MSIPKLPPEPFSRRKPPAALPALGDGPPAAATGESFLRASFGAAAAPLERKLVFVIMPFAYLDAVVEMIAV